MFGGLAFLLEGKMFCGIVKDDLMVRIGPERQDKALARPHVRPMAFTGKPFIGYVFVAPAGYAGGRLAPWIEAGSRFVRSLSATSPKRSGRPPLPRGATRR